MVRHERLAGLNSRPSAPSYELAAFNMRGALRFKHSAQRLPSLVVVAILSFGHYCRTMDSASRRLSYGRMVTSPEYAKPKRHRYQGSFTYSQKRVGENLDL